MAGCPDPEKEKITYGEWTDVRDEITKIRHELTAKERAAGRLDPDKEIPESEMYRRITLEYVNRRRKAKKQRPLDLDPAAGPGGVASPNPRRRAA